MTSLLEDANVRRIAATLGVAGSVALGYFYVLVPLLTVPGLARYGFYVAWGVLVVLSLAWWRGHPWRSFAVPIIGLVGVLAALWSGTTYLGWAP